MLEQLAAWPLEKFLSFLIPITVAAFYIKKSDILPSCFKNCLTHQLFSSVCFCLLFGKLIAVN